ncbi:MAG: hypothetical protein ACK5PF_06435, partial [bacterium]
LLLGHINAQPKLNQTLHRSDLPRMRAREAKSKRHWGAGSRLRPKLPFGLSNEETVKAVHLTHGLGRLAALGPKS